MITGDLALITARARAAASSPSWSHELDFHRKYARSLHELRDAPENIGIRESFARNLNKLISWNAGSPGVMFEMMSNADFFMGRVSIMTAGERVRAELVSADIVLRDPIDPGIAAQTDHFILRNGQPSIVDSKIGRNPPDADAEDLMERQGIVTMDNHDLNNWPPELSWKRKYRPLQADWDMVARVESEIPGLDVRYIDSTGADW